MSSQTDQLQSPLPPPDLNNRKICVKELNLGFVELFRVHWLTKGPIHYNRKSVTNKVFRWDSATDRFGVLYVAPDLGTCLAETVFREMFQGPVNGLAIDERVLRERAVSRLGCNDKAVLRLADLTRDLYLIGADGNICTTEQNKYEVPNKWSDALHAHHDMFDGIYYPSRYAGTPAVAIFDRTRMLPRAEPISLVDSPEVDTFLSEHGIVVIPDGLDGRGPDPDA